MDELLLSVESTLRQSEHDLVRIAVDVCDDLDKDAALETGEEKLRLAEEGSKGSLILVCLCSWL